VYYKANGHLAPLLPMRFMNVVNIVGGW